MRARILQLTDDGFGDDPAYGAPQVWSGRFEDVDDALRTLGLPLEELVVSLGNEPTIWATDFLARRRA